MHRRPLLPTTSAPDRRSGTFDARSLRSMAHLCGRHWPLRPGADGWGLERGRPARRARWDQTQGQSDDVTNAQPIDTEPTQPQLTARRRPPFSSAVGRESTPFSADPQECRWGKREGWLIDKTIMPIHCAPCRKPDDREIKNKKMPKDIWRRTTVNPKVYRQPLHCFRKGFVSEMAYLRVPEHLRKHLVGHSNGVHGDVYTVFRVLEEQLQEAVALIPPIHDSNILPLKVGDSLVTMTAARTAK